MPEGDTLLRTAAALGERMGGKVCRAIVPDSFRRLVGRRIMAVDAVGKHLFIRFDGGLSLHSHLRMRGTWHIYRPGEAWRQARHEATAVLTLDDWVAVLFAGAVCEIVADDSRVAHLGPDVLGESFDMEQVIARVRRTGQSAVGEVLLDQTVCAGIGNIYRCESLFLRRINPWSPARKLDDQALTDLYRVTRRLMREAAYGVDTSRRRWVHARGGRPCRRCAARVRVAPQGDMARLTYWCPACQEAQTG
jgi:endonuclease-8